MIVVANILRNIAAKLKPMGLGLAAKFLSRMASHSELRDNIETLYRGHHALVQLLEKVKHEPTSSSKKALADHAKAKARIEDLEWELLHLSEEIIDEILPAYEKWHSFHSTAENWWDQQAEEAEECGEGCGGLCEEGFSRYGDFDGVVDIRDSVKDKLSELGVFRHDDDYIEESVRDLLKEGHIDKYVQKYLGLDEEPELSEDKIEELAEDQKFWHFLDENGQLEMNFDPEDLYGSNWISQLKQEDPRIDRVLREVGISEGYPAWRQLFEARFGTKLDDCEKAVAEAVRRLKEAQSSQDLGKSLVAINYALQTQHVYGKMAEKIDMGQSDLDYLSNLAL